MALTLREKEHWRNRISRKLDQAIETILTEVGPEYMQQLSADANQRAVQSLGLAEAVKQLNELGKQQRDIDAQRDQLREQERDISEQVNAVYRQQLAIVRGDQVEDVETVYQHSYQMIEVKSAVASRQKHIERDLLQNDETGRRIMKLRHEKEELLDTVWLATSSSQIKELWGTVAEVLNQEPTELQKEAMSIDPVEVA